MNFGLPSPEITRADLLRGLFETIRSFQIPTLCVPTFTFSFCNGQDFDVRNTRSRMGALTEYIRQQPDALRSVDPLLSVAVLGKHTDLVHNLGKLSIGEGSFYHRLSQQRRVTFLFFGTELGACFTYMHFLEERAKVPYRYNRDFSGRITDSLKQYEDTYTLFVRYNNVTPNERAYEYQQELQRNGDLKVRQIGDGKAMAVDMDTASALYNDFLIRDPNYFITRPFDPLTTDTSFNAHEMTSL
jgi:aminoglycoside 3-N-acetyltransferase